MSDPNPGLLEDWLAEAGRRGCLWHSVRPDRHGPEYLAGTLYRDGVADVVVLSGEDYAHAYRTPAGREDDIFHPTLVWWWYGHTPVWVVRAWLTLPDPGHPEAPDHLMRPPAPTGVPGDLRPVRIQPGRRVGLPMVRS